MQAFAQAAAAPPAAAPAQPAGAALELVRGAPPGFSAAIKDGIDFALKHNKTVYRNIVFVQSAQNENEFVLLPVSAGPLRGLLRSLGLYEPAVDELVRRVRWRLEDSDCVAVQEQPQLCVRLSIKPGDKLAAKNPPDSGNSLAAMNVLELVIEQSDLTLRQETIAEELALTGGTYGYFGQSKTSKALGLGTWGVVSAGQKRAEYDLGVSYTPDQAGAARKTRIRLNTLIGGMPVSGGMGFAGLFRGASGGQAFGASGALNFFSRPAQWGVAWQSDDSKLSDVGVKRSVQVALAAPAFVRVLADGQELYQSQRPAGDQKVEFSGFTGSFVDVEIRPISGGETVTRRLEVSRVIQEESSTLRTKIDTSFWYADIGRVIAELPGAANNLGQTDVTQASLAYTYLLQDQVLQFALQSVNRHVRAGVAMSDRDNSWAVNAMGGLQGEKGLSASWQPSLGWLRAGLGFTEYRPPTQAGAVSKNCVDGLESFCFSNWASGYSSRSASLGIAGFPVRLGTSWTRNNNNWTRFTTVSAGFAVGAIRQGAFTNIELQKSNQTKGINFYASLTVPLQPDNGGSAYLRGSLGGRTNGGSSYALEYSEQLPELEEGIRLISSYSLNVQGGLGSSASSSATNFSGNLVSQLGVVRNTTNVTHNQNSGTAINASFSTNYSLSRAGLAFKIDGSQSSGVGSLGSSGDAAVAVHNRSFEPQVVLVNGQEKTVAPQSNIMIAVRAGYLDDIRVSPGPAQEVGTAMEGQTLFKGNVKNVIVPDGSWILARFKDVNAPAGSKAFLDVAFTFKRPGDAIERIYPNATGEVTLFEYKENGEDIVRYVSLSGAAKEYRCVAKASDMPKPGAITSYAEVQYSCSLVPAGSRKAAGDGNEQLGNAAKEPQALSGAGAALAR